MDSSVKVNDDVVNRLVTSKASDGFCLPSKPGMNGKTGSDQLGYG